MLTILYEIFNITAAPDNSDVNLTEGDNIRFCTVQTECYMPNPCQILLRLLFQIFLS